MKRQVFRRGVMAQFQRKCDDNSYADAELLYYNLDLKIENDL